MPYKSIDLQASIPRTPDVAALQNQMMHKPVADQTRLEEASVKETELMRRKNSAVEQSDKLNIKDNKQREAESNAKRRKNAGDSEDSQEPAETQTPQSPQHPFKGQHIDISL
ncbi:hypothetical protein PAECIP111893_00983 [Paenibacillus plantiphilus]|uniref:Uncharacterized protein n=1 Tax=Paenibacillus plantiphilus TaxID=2905650 RepID=A0ABM9C096_9BACL|nr:hypothetical protein [Paenibacillus plantiphilus]CAH1197798.1 hypothetical protein PAECIP111893_00983 [Paenibacillus plantiphilus]